MSFPSDIPIISSDEAMRLIGTPEIFSIYTGPQGIAVFADRDEPPNDLIAYLSLDAVAEWLRKGWLEEADYCPDALDVTTLAYAEANRRKTGVLSPLSVLLS